MYFHILPERDLGRAYNCTGVPTWERLAFPLLLGVMSGYIRHLFAIGPETPAQAGAAVQETFDAVAARLGDGRRYLCGDAFTAADLAFAALAAPVLVPPQYGVALPQPVELPSGHGRGGARPSGPIPRGRSPCACSARSADQGPSAALSTNCGRRRRHLGGLDVEDRRRAVGRERHLDERAGAPKLALLQRLGDDGLRRPDGAGRTDGGLDAHVASAGRRAPGERHAAVGGRHGGRRQVPASPFGHDLRRRQRPAGLGSGREDRARDAVVAHRVVVAEVLTAPGQRHAAVLVGGDGDAAHVVAGRGDRADRREGVPRGPAQSADEVAGARAADRACAGAMVDPRQRGRPALARGGDEPHHPVGRGEPLDLADLRRPRSPRPT